MTGMIMRSYFDMLALAAVLVILSTTSTVSAYSIEREATVQLLPNDLLDVETTVSPEEPETNQTVSTPQEVINNQIVKIAESLHEAMEDTRRNMRLKKTEKRDLAPGNYLPYVIPLLTCVVKLANSGVLPGSVLKGLLPIQNGLQQQNKFQPLCALVSKRDPVAGALDNVPMGGAVTDLTGGRSSMLHGKLPSSPSLPGKLPSSSSLPGGLGVPGAGIAGGTATRLVTGAALGLAVPGAAGVAKDTVPVGGSALGGAVGMAPPAVARPLAQRSDLLIGFKAGFAAGLSAGEVARTAGMSVLPVV